MTKGRDSRDTVTPAEAASALQKLSKADRARLEQFARLRVSGLPGLDWEDLLHEAIDRILSGSRRWPRSIPLVAFMCGTIRSISSDLWRERKFKFEVPLAGGEDDDRTTIDPADESPGPEREAMARAALDRILGLFENDQNALAVLQGLADGSSPEEIQRASAMTAKEYASAQKRIRRRMATAIEE